MVLTTTIRKILWARSGGFCALCKAPLTEDAAGSDPDIVLGEEAHIVSAKPGGPRYRPLPADQLDVLDNVILLCPTDHTKVDAQESHYTEEMLRRIKQDHEEWARARTATPSPLTQIRVRDLAPDDPTTLLHVATGGQLMRVVGSRESLATVRPDPLDDDEVDLIASFFQGAMDWGELWDELGPGERVRAECEIGKEIESLRDAGFVVYAGIRRQALEGGIGGPRRWVAATLAVYRSDDPAIRPAETADEIPIAQTRPA